ncbi:MAG: hypothetical protein WC175_02460 [Candidatus Dojkabacteria bacterium]
MTTLMEDFHKNYKYYDEDRGKSLKNVNIKEDLEKLATSMDSFTEEEALVQLLSKYRRKGFNTVLLLAFRNKYKNLLRWIRTPELIIDPQEYIDYEKKEILPITDRKLVDDIREASKKCNGGKYPIRFYTLKEEETLTEDFDSTWSSVAANFVDNIPYSLDEAIDTVVQEMDNRWKSVETEFIVNIGEIKDFLLNHSTTMDTAGNLKLILDNEDTLKAFLNLNKINKKLMRNKNSKLVIGSTESGRFSFAYVRYETNAASFDKIWAEELTNIKNGMYKSEADVYMKTPLLTTEELKQFELNIFLNIALFKNPRVEYTAREITAIYLHEIGHFLTYRQITALTLLKVNDYTLNKLRLELNKAFKTNTPIFDKIINRRVNDDFNEGWEVSADSLAVRYGFKEDAISALQKTRKFILFLNRRDPKYLLKSFIDPSLPRRVLKLRNTDINIV